MKRKNTSLVLRVLFGLTLLGVAGISSAGPYPESLSIHVSPGFPRMNIIDLHFYPAAGVYFSFSTGHYYYPTPRGWHQSRTLPRHFHINPRENVIAHGDMHKRNLKHKSHYEQNRHRENHHKRGQWEREDQHGRDNRHGDHDRRDRGRG